MCVYTLHTQLDECQPLAGCSMPFELFMKLICNRVGDKNLKWIAIIEIWGILGQISTKMVCISEKSSDVITHIKANEISTISVFNTTLVGLWSK